MSLTVMNGKSLLTMGIDPDNDVPVNGGDLGFRHPSTSLPHSSKTNDTHIRRISNYGLSHSTRHKVGLLDTLVRIYYNILYTGNVVEFNMSF